jgi:hypothetical protein
MKEASGIMPLSDVYCVVNRARGLAGLVSPEDIIAACGQLQSVTRFTDEPMVYKVFSSGVKCVQLAELGDDDRIIDDTMKKVSEFFPWKKLESRDYVVLTVCHSSYSC